MNGLGESLAHMDATLNPDCYSQFPWRGQDGGAFGGGRSCSGTGFYGAISVGQSQGRLLKY